MWRRWRTAVALLSVVVLFAALVGCSRDNRQERRTTPQAGEYAESLREKVGTDAMFAHLQQLQQIADANGGNRAAGTPGYDASLEYVVKTLRDSGFDVQTPEFDFRKFEPGPVSLTVNGATVPAQVMEYSVGTGPDGVTGPLVVAPGPPGDETPGCSASDYDGLPVSGAVILVDRGYCQFSIKEAAAAQRGAVAMIVADNVDEEKISATLGARTDVKIPVIGISKADGAKLRAQPGPAAIKVDAKLTTIKARNVIAQTKTGSTQNVVIAGAHLDSVPEGPGINDNGSGVAAVLETAVQMGSSPPIQNAVRFAFWGAEEAGLVGSMKYIESLDIDALKDIALYMNFDMIASPNPGYFTYDGDQSSPLGPDENPPRVPEGSAGIERTLVAYLTNAGKTAEDTSFDGRSDYDGFTQAGIPSGGLFSGAEEKKSAEQAELWGGEADQPFDPNYHKPTDTLQHIDRTALGIHGAGVAYAVGLYSEDIAGRNGVPVRDDRTRHVVNS
ncbi:MAG TPA: M28 family metallopeptidase [Mycobacterium sp.]|nr:M28 family metallopeptidase [Mycobacterium sp.]